MLVNIFKLFIDLLYILPDHARQAVHGVLVKPSLIQNNVLTSIVVCERKLLQQVREHVSASDVNFSVSA